MANPVSNGAGTSNYTYDNRDRLKTITLPGAASSAINYTYDKVGNRTKVANTSSGGAGTANYSYDLANMLVTVNNTTFTFTFT